MKFDYMYLYLNSYILCLSSYPFYVERILMTCHLTLFLACFSVFFSRFYQQNREVLE